MVAAAVVVIAVAITAFATQGFGLGWGRTPVGSGTAAGDRGTSGQKGSPPAPANWGCPITGGAGFGASDDGFNAGGIEFTADTSGSTVCFFDGVSTWNLDGRGPLTAAVTGVGTFVPMMADAKPTQGRLVWGVLGDDAVSVHLATGSTPKRPVAGSTVTPGVRVFYARVPATGTVTVTAEDSSGTVLTTQTLG